VNDRPNRPLGNPAARQTPERRASPRFLIPPLAVTIDRKSYQTVDWGVGALVIGGYDGPLGLYTQVTVTLSCAAAPEVTHQAKMRVLRLDPRRHQLTLQYVEVAKALLGWLGALQASGGAPGVPHGA
jgi:hypothetical protein